MHQLAVPVCVKSYSCKTKKDEAKSTTQTCTVRSAWMVKTHEFSIQIPVPQKKKEGGTAMQIDNL